MQLSYCAACGASNRPEAPYCMRCGKPLARPDCAAAAHARAFVERELRGPFLGAFPEALDFSAASLTRLDALMEQMWGTAGEAPGDTSWQPGAGKLQVITDFGAYLGEVLCRVLPARWEMNPAHPQAVIAARVVDAKGLRINTFAQVGVRFRDGDGVGLDSLLVALTGRPTAIPARPAPVARVDAATLLREAEAQAAAGRGTAAIELYRQVLAIEPGHAKARLQLAFWLALSGATAAALTELDEFKRQLPQDPQGFDTRALILAQAGRTDEALGTLDMALLRQPGELLLLRRRGLVRLQAGQFKRAQADLELLLQQQPADAEVLLGVAHCLEQQGQFELARERLRTLLQLPAAQRSAELDAAARKALAQLEQRLSAPAPVVAPVMATDPAAALFAEAVQLAQARRFNQALPLFMEASRLQPGRASYLKDVGQCLKDLGQPAQAQAWLQRSLEIDRADGQARWLLGQIAEQLGQAAAAISQYRSLLAESSSAQRYVDLAFDRLKALGALPG